MTKTHKTPKTSAISALNALDLALESQKLEVEATNATRRWLPLLDQIEKVCRDFDKLSPDDAVARGEAVAILADVAVEVASSVGLQRYEDVGLEVSSERHDVADTVVSDGEPGRVASVHEVGWCLDGRPLRRAKVVATTKG